MIRISSIISASSFIEANINELFCDTIQKDINLINHDKNLKMIDKELIIRMASVWDLIKKSPTLNKYNVALKLANKNAFNKRSSLYQNVNLLRDLRNALVHYKIEWIECLNSHKQDENEIHEIGKKLKGKFPLNKIFKKASNPFYPDRCLSSGFAQSLTSLNSNVYGLPSTGIS